jgi:rRNA small subunit pseudouridine methyltransferase Nep1
LVKTFFILADAALELVPKKIWKHSAVRKTAQRRNKKPSEILLESSHHHSAMHDIIDKRKRGRPDIIHLCLLSILNTPLIIAQPKDVVILVHSYKGVLIQINPLTRLPKQYNRFIGLMEDLFTKRIIQSRNKTLLKILTNTSLEKQLELVSKRNRFIFTRKGKKRAIKEETQSRRTTDIAYIIGGFPHGNFSHEINQLTTNLIALSDYSLDAWTVLCRMVYLREQSLEL